MEEQDAINELAGKDISLSEEQIEKIIKAAESADGLVIWINKFPFRVEGSNNNVTGNTFRSEIIIQKFPTGRNFFHRLRMLLKWLYTGK